eukprot:m.57398 g.57398  ORF g.57398 m.57398 type:complete len:89 (-) comp9351_c0_seq1:675-941(-)
MTAVIPDKKAHAQMTADAGELRVAARAINEAIVSVKVATCATFSCLATPKNPLHHIALQEAVKLEPVAHAASACSAGGAVHPSFAHQE